MSGQRDVSPLTLLIGMPVLSLATGNKLGLVKELLIDPLSGVLHSLNLDTGTILCGHIHSIGRDAIMADSDLAVHPREKSEVSGGRNARKLFGTRVVTESGEMIGRISNLFVTLRPQPFVIVEIRRSWLDTLLRRGVYLAASAAFALSDDSARLVVPDTAAELASSNLEGLVHRTIDVRTFAPPAPEDDGDETVLRVVDDDDDKTVVRLGDDDETVVRRPRP